MYFKYISYFFLFFFCDFMAYGQNGSIKGRVISYKNEPLVGISVLLQGTVLGTTTDTNGDFIINNIPGGTYTVVVSSTGYSAVKRNILIDANKTEIIDLQLSENRQELQDVTVIAKQDAYRQGNSSIGTRTDIPLLELPQSAQVVTQQTIRDKQAFTLNELATVMTGVRANNSMGAFSMRGFTGYYPFNANFIMFNGIRGNLYLWSQAPLLYNIESVETLRGPASALFSEGMPGGVINFVTKKPQVAKTYEFTAAYGSWNMARFSADATGAISKDKKLRYRAIVGYDRSNSFRDYQKVENLFIAPSLAYQFSEKTSLNLEVNYAQAKTVQQYDRGTYVKNLPDGSYDFNYYPTNLTIQSPTDFGNTHNSSATLTFDHRFNDRLKLSVVQRYVRNKFEFADHFISGNIRNDSISRNYEIWDYDQFSYQTTAFLNYKIGMGSIKHDILVGMDYNNYGWYNNDYRSGPSTRISIFNPNYTNDIPAPNPAVDYYDDNKQTNQLIGGYAQDMVSIGSKWKALLSLRYDSYSLKQTPLSARDDAQGDQSDAHAWIPRFGLVYLPRPNISFYSSYTQAFNPQLSNNGGAGGPFPPKTSTQYEVGYKGDFFHNMLSTMLAFYTIDYHNVLAPAPTPTQPNLQAVVPGTRSKGFELTIQGKLKDFSIIGGYAFNQHELTADNSLGKKGYSFSNAPKHIANIWIKYDFSRTALKGLGLGFGGRYVSTQVGILSIQNFIIPASTVLDASANYTVAKFNFQLNMNNLANTRYFLSGLSKIGTASLGNPSNFRLSISYRIY